ncbi:hypothetical protein AADR41_15790 [Streptomyces sp. CLV115]|uniref:hypothetical protein n=1 Tax=Streptomyces sp. CLV115 TaxID=3138502 RepID=UPI00313CC624
MTSIALGWAVHHGGVMSTEAEPVEHDDRWILNFREPGVAGITVDYRLTPALDEGWEFGTNVVSAVAFKSRHAPDGVRG